jgi:hypothetical protein
MYGLGAACTIKKFVVFPVPSRDVTYQTLHGQELFTDIPAGGGKNDNLFCSVPPLLPFSQLSSSEDSVVRWTSPRKDVCGSRCLLGGEDATPPPLFGFGEVRICCIRVHQLKGQFSRYM